MEVCGPHLGGERGWLHSPGLSGHMPFEHLQHSWSAGHFGLQQEAKPHLAQVGMLSCSCWNCLMSIPCCLTQQCGVSCCDLSAVLEHLLPKPVQLPGTTLLPTSHSSCGTRELKAGF